MKQFYFVEKGVRSQVVNQTASADELRQAMLRCNTEQLIASHRSFDPDGEVKKRMLCLIVGEHIAGQPLTRLDANFRHGSHILLDFDEPCDPAAMAALFVQRLAAGLAEVVNHCYIEESVSGKIHLLAPRLSDDVGEDIFAYSEFFFGDGADDPMFDRTCKNTSRLCILTGHALAGSCLENLQRDIPAGLLSALRAAVYGGEGVAMLDNATLVTPSASLHSARPYSVVQSTALPSLGTAWHSANPLKTSFAINRGTVGGVFSHPKGTHQQTPPLFIEGVPEGWGSSKPTANFPEPTANSQEQSAEQYCGLDLSLITDCLLAEFGGIPSEGQRNQVLYMLAKELLSITDNNEALVAQLIAPYKWFGLPETEARGTIHSAAKKYEPQRRRTAIMDKALSQALARQGVASTVQLSSHTSVAIPTAAQPTVYSLQSDTETTVMAAAEEAPSFTFNPFAAEPPQMPDFKRLPKAVQHWLKNVHGYDFLYPHIINCAEAASSIHLIDSQIVGIDGTPRFLDTGWLCITLAPMASGKESRGPVCDSILKDFIEEDHRIRTEVEAWKEKSSRKRSSDMEEECPKNQSHIVGSSVSPAALMKRLRELEKGALYLETSELTNLDLLGNGGDTSTIPLLAFDAGVWRVDRSSDVGVSGAVRVRLDLCCTSTVAGGRKTLFTDGCYSNGMLSRFSFANILTPDVDLDVRYGAYDDDYQSKMDGFVDLLRAEQGKLISCPKAEKHARAMREETLQLAAEFSSEPLRIISRRYAIIQQKRNVVYWILNGKKWNRRLEEFLTWRYRYSVWSLFALFGSQIDKEQSIEEGAIIKSRQYGPVNFLESLPEAFTVEDLKNLRRLKGKSNDTKSISRQLYTWKSRSLIQEAPEQPGVFINLKKRPAV